MDLSFAFDKYCTHTHLRNGIIRQSLKDPAQRASTIRLIEDFIQNEVMYNNFQFPLISPTNPGDVTNYANVPVDLSDFESEDKDGLETIAQRMFYLCHNQNKGLQSTKDFYA